MKYYEIKNKKTGEHFSAVAKNFAMACKMHDCKPNDCHCVYSCKAEEEE